MTIICEYRFELIPDCTKLIGKNLTFLFKFSLKVPHLAASVNCHAFCACGPQRNVCYSDKANTAHVSRFKSYIRHIYFKRTSTDGSRDGNTSIKTSKKQSTKLATWLYGSLWRRANATNVTLLPSL